MKNEQNNKKIERFMSKNKENFILYDIWSKIGEVYEMSLSSSTDYRISNDLDRLKTYQDQI